MGIDIEQVNSPAEITLEMLKGATAEEIAALESKFGIEIDVPTNIEQLENLNSIMARVSAAEKRALKKLGIKNNKPEPE